MMEKSFAHLWTFSILFALLSIVTQSQTKNTHQTITTNKPKMFKLSVVKGENISISVFGTNAQFQILFQMDIQQLAVTKESICFKDEKCSLEFKSLWDANGVVIIQVLSHQYSYEIIKNGVQVKKQENVLANFVGGRFVYQKMLFPDNYIFKVSYESQFVPEITMTFLDKNFTIKANKMNDVIFNLEGITPFYMITFSLNSDQGFQSISEHLFQINLQIPNHMLKGCDGTNIYDPLIRACPVPNIKTHDTLKINKIGSYPTFQLDQQTQVQIKITIFQYKKWNDLFLDQFLTVYIADSNDPRVFYGLNKFQIATRFKTKQQCSMKSTSCMFNFTLSKGSYVIMPVFLRSQKNSFVYLYERYNKNLLMQNFYSVLPTINQEDKKFYQLGAMFQFFNHKQRLTQLSIKSKDPFLLGEYVIFKKSLFPNPFLGMQLDIVQIGSDKVFNQDLYEAKIFTQLEGNQSYLLLVELISQRKFSQAQKLQDEEGEDVIDFDSQDDVGSEYESSEKIQYKQGLFYHQTDQIELKIKNGRFPHRKISSKQQQENQPAQQKQSSEDNNLQKQKDGSQGVGNDSNQLQNNPMSMTRKDAKGEITKLLLQILGVLVGILVILILMYVFCLSKGSQQNERSQLVTEQQSGSITLPDNSVQVLQIIKTESSVVSQNQHSQELEQYSEKRNSSSSQQ